MRAVMPNIKKRTDSIPMRQGLPHPNHVSLGDRDSIDLFMNDFKKNFINLFNFFFSAARPAQDHTSLKEIVVLFSLLPSENIMVHLRNRTIMGAKIFISIPASYYDLHLSISSK
jgi:hypothetical protein